MEPDNGENSSAGDVISSQISSYQYHKSSYQYHISSYQIWPGMQGMVSVCHTIGKGWYFDFRVCHTAKLTQTKLWRPISQAIQTLWKFCSNRLKAMAFYFKKNLNVLITKKWKLVKILFLSWPIHFVSATSLTMCLPHPLQGVCHIPRLLFF